MGRKGNGLALLANKCAARTFDISSGMVYASMRDQIVRAQLLIRDLKEHDGRCRNLLIVGAGVAGLAAATSAKEHGFDVLVLESAATPFSLQKNVSTRFVGPFMYEWPNIVAHNQNYPMPKSGLGSAAAGSPSWTSQAPLPANVLANHLEAWFTDYQNSHSGTPAVLYAVNKQQVKDYVNDFVKKVGAARATTFISPPLYTYEMAGRRKSFAPDYIILAVGMGVERVHLIDGKKMSGKRFWENDDFRSFALMPWKAGVFGGGDGALQDVLRLLTKYDHPLELIHDFEAGPAQSYLSAVRPELDSLEQQSRLLATWSDAPVYDLIDSQCRAICDLLLTEPVVRAFVESCLRNGSGKVTHIYPGSGFSKCYLLNRFVVHLFGAYFSRIGNPLAKRVSYRTVPNTKAIDCSMAQGKYVVKLDNGAIESFNRIAVRFGPGQKALAQGQIIQLEPGTKAERLAMSGIPLPYVVHD